MSSTPRDYLERVIRVDHAGEYGAGCYDDAETSFHRPAPLAKLGSTTPGKVGG